MSVPVIGPGPIICCHPHILVAGQEQWSGSHFGCQVALVGLGVSISKTLTPRLVLLKSQWEVPSPCHWQGCLKLLRKGNPCPESKLMF